jgi:hypothetical protein
MHDLIFAVAFVAMVATPAMVAAIGGRKDFDPGPAAPALRSRTTVTGMNVRPFTPTVRPRSAGRVVREQRRFVILDGPTLPMHNARGMANR